MNLAKFYPVFDDVDWLRRMLPLGVKIVQMRLKDKSDHELRVQIYEAQNLCAKYGAILVLNDYWKLAIDLKCTCIHLGQEDLDTADLKAIRQAGLKVGVSTHDEQELERALSLKPDYIALGPIYPTILKKMKWHQQGVEKLTDWKLKIGNIPLVAIGGMTVERATGAFLAGANVVSAVTDITLNDNPETRVRKWLDTCK